NTDGTGALTTSYDYTWFSGTVQVESETITWPTIGSAQNGPGSAASETIFFDSYGRPIWTKDAEGYLSYVSYDPGTGAVLKVIQDVNTATTSDFVDLPSGWSTPSGGGLHLKSTFEVDQPEGRSTKSLVVAEFTS